MLRASKPCVPLLIATLTPAPNEYLGRDNPSGGSIDVYSSEETSDFFDWIAIGS